MRLLKEKCGEISPSMFGLFFEDINFAADGGLYAELIENRSFEAKEGFGISTNFYCVDDNGYAWSAVNGGGLKYVTGTPLSMSNPHYLRFTANVAGDGFKNKCYDGIAAKKGEKINVKFYARAVEFEGSFEVSILKNNEKLVSETVKCVPVLPFACFANLTVDFIPDSEEDNKKIAYINGLDKSKYSPASSWVKYETTLVIDEDIEDAEFAICLDAPGAVDFDFISAIPESAVAGVFRKDLFDALKAMKPGFLRFPGGCIVEGISLENRYQWKRTVGNPIHRKYIQNLWAFEYEGKNGINAQVPDCHYGQSYGIGFYEYFLLCELIGAKPLPVLSMGIACQFRSTEVTDINSDEFYEFVQDAIDLIEFANGGVDTKWGSLRAKMGHEEPFNLEMLGVGNEQWETQTLQLFDRNDIIETAIHKAYPDIKLIGTAGPVVDMKTADIAWDYYRNGMKKNSNFVYAVDEHYYKPPKWMLENVNLYDDYERDVPVFAGEYACHKDNRANDINAAVIEAAFMTGLEKNADIVKLASYAPLFNRIGHSQWVPDMIWFDEKAVYLTPNYHVQRMYANNVGKHILRLSDEAIRLREDGVYVSTTLDETGGVILKVANTREDDYILELEDELGNPLSVDATAEILVSAGEMIPGMPEPSEVKKQQIGIEGSVVLPKQSFSVIRF